MHEWCDGSRGPITCGSEGITRQLEDNVEKEQKGSDSGGERAAIAFSILGSCRLAGADPIEYLTDVLPKLTRRVRLLDLPALLPSPWAAARAAT